LKPKGLDFEGEFVCEGSHVERGAGSSSKLDVPGSGGWGIESVNALINSEEVLKIWGPREYRN
jgi:hypothetical protein